MYGPEPMKQFLIMAVFLALPLSASGQRADTVSVGKRDLELRNLRLGNSTYIVYFKKTPTGPAERITLVRISVESTLVSGRNVFSITQQWESADEVVHTSKTLHDAADFSTVWHETWWKRLGYSAKFDFTAKQVEFTGPIEDSAKSKIIEDFNQSFANYNLCWHSDLVIFPLFRYKDGRTFVVKFYDPGFGSTQNATYEVTGSEFLVASEGSKIDCWKLEHKFDISSGGSGVQRFWISKRTHEVLKEEDQTPTGYRYKMKIGISGEK
jgi:hypothetical protein